MSDPIEKLISTESPPARKKRTRGKKAKRGTGNAFSFVLNPKQSIVLRRVSKHVGISQYIRNLIRQDVEAEGEEWPEERQS